MVDETIRENFKINVHYSFLAPCISRRMWEDWFFVATLTISIKSGVNLTTYREIYYPDKKVESVYHTSQKPKQSAQGGIRKLTKVFWIFAWHGFAATHL